MALDEANALVKLLLDEETQPERRAKLVALQLALGWPYALEVQPEHLAELRTRQLDAWRASVWLGAASSLAFVWCTGGTASSAFLMYGDSSLSVVFAAFVIGVIHAAFGVVQAAGQSPTRSVLRVLTWMWLVGPAFMSVVTITWSSDAFWWALICATPSMLVSLAASRVARHTPAR